MLPDNEFLTKWGSKYSPVTNQAELPFVENSNNAYLIDTTPWTVIAATGTYVKSQAKGNKNIGMTSEGQLAMIGEMWCKIAQYQLTLLRQYKVRTIIFFLQNG